MQCGCCRQYFLEVLRKATDLEPLAAVSTAELLKQHIAKSRIGLVDVDCVHEFLNVVIHGSSFKTCEVTMISGRVELAIKEKGAWPTNGATPEDPCMHGRRLFAHGLGRFVHTPTDFC
jgi:hypothetical protein